MKCPLVFSSNVTGMGEQRFVFADCLKEECAWWARNIDECVINAHYRVFSSILNRLDSIETRMPYEGQFRR